MEPDASPREDVSALFQEHGGAVLRFALVMLRNQADAEDVVQETFLKLLHHLHAAGDRTNLRGWLFTVAAHAAHDRLRRRARWIPWTTANDRSVQPPSLPDEDGRIRVVREAMHRMAPRDRLLLALRAQGLSYQEIAQAAGLRPASVGRLLARAIGRWERACQARATLPHAYGRTPS